MPLSLPRLARPLGTRKAVVIVMMVEGEVLPVSEELFLRGLLERK